MSHRRSVAGLPTPPPAEAMRSRGESICSAVENRGWLPSMAARCDVQRADMCAAAVCAAGLGVSAFLVVMLFWCRCC